MAWILMGHTAGDDLFPSKQVPMCAADSKAEIEAEHERINAKREDWLSINKNSIRPWESSGVYVRFEIVEVPAPGLL